MRTESATKAKEGRTEERKKKWLLNVRLRLKRRKQNRDAYNAVLEEKSESPNGK